MRDELNELGAITALAIRAAEEAGALALQGFRSRGLRVTVKSDMHDLVTHYDEACEALIRSRILAEYPDSSIIGEESAWHQGSGSLSWFIDPIDGTSNFARGIAMWAVSIGVAQDGKMIAGVIYDPANGQLFWADHRGAYLRDTTALASAHIETTLPTVQDVPLHSWGNTNPSAATIALNFPLARDLVHFPELALRQFAEVTTSFSQIRNLGSTCIALAWIAAGWLDATISFETHPWDVAAGAFIIRRAGGIYRGYRDGAIEEEARDYLSPHYYAAVPGGDFDALHDIMRSQSLRPDA